MSDFSLTLVLQIKTSKIINDMAKVQQKSEKINAFGGLFFGQSEGQVPLIDTAYLATAYQKTSSCLRNFDEETWLAKIQLHFFVIFLL